MQLCVSYFYALISFLLNYISTFKTFPFLKCHQSTFKFSSLLFTYYYVLKFAKMKNKSANSFVPYLKKHLLLAKQAQL